MSNSLSEFWFRATRQIVGNHLVSASVDDFHSPARRFHKVLHSGYVLTKKTTPMSFECVVRGDFDVPGWLEYTRKGSVCTVKLPPGLNRAERLQHPVFSATATAKSGHAVSVAKSEMSKIIA